MNYVSVRSVLRHVRVKSGLVPLLAVAPNAGVAQPLLTQLAAQCLVAATFGLEALTP